MSIQLSDVLVWRVDAKNPNGRNLAANGRFSIAQFSKLPNYPISGELVPVPARTIRFLRPICRV
jgi:hypothetical protein